MYFRYFMWNFAGRQNNLQSYGGITKGNWISGIPFIDKAITGNQKNLPDKIKKTKAEIHITCFRLFSELSDCYFLIRKKKNFW